jgi:hypothetical protein
MSISIEYRNLWFDQQDLKFKCINYIESNIGKPDKLTILKDNESDLESSFSILFYFKNISYDDFSFWDELSDFSDEFEIDVFVYDHLTHNIKDYLYGEDWDETNSGVNLIYLNSI